MNRAFAAEVRWTRPAVSGLTSFGGLFVSMIRRCGRLWLSASASSASLGSEVARTRPRRRSPSWSSCRRPSTLAVRICRTSCRTSSHLGLPQDLRSSPRTGFLTDRLTGSNDLNPSLGLLYAVTVTRDLGARASAGAPFPERGGTILHLLSGVEWQLSRRWALIPTISGSLPSTTQTSISVPYQDTSGAQTTLAGDLKVKASSVGGELSAEFDTLDAGRVELVFTMTGGLTNYWITQGLAKLQLADDTIVSSAALQQQCQTSGCTQDVRNLLSKPSTNVIQVYAEGDLTALLGRTDVGITGSGYGYSQDPGQLGFFGVAGFARGPSTGDGYPIAPLLFDVRGHVLEKLGAWRLAASGDYGRYVDAEGWNVTGSLKATYSVTKRIRLWATGTLPTRQGRVTGRRQHGRGGGRTAVDLLSTPRSLRRATKRRQPISCREGRGSRKRPTGRVAGAHWAARKRPSTRKVHP